LCVACRLMSRFIDHCSTGFIWLTATAAKEAAMRAIEVTDPKAWDDLISQLPQAHLLQTWEWGLLKQRNGWTPQAFVWDSVDGRVDATAMLLSRQVRLVPGLGIRVLYCPKGPSLNWG